MKIMSLLSRLSGGQLRPSASIVQPGHHFVVPTIRSRRHDMVWETPAAIDYRYGFEINLYIAAR